MPAKLAKKNGTTENNKRGFHLLINGDILKAAKVRCVQQEINLSDVIEALVDKWNAGKCPVRVRMTKRSRYRRSSRHR